MTDRSLCELAGMLTKGDSRSLFSKSCHGTAPVAWFLLARLPALPYTGMRTNLAHNLECPCGIFSRKEENEVYEPAVLSLVQPNDF